MSTQAAASTAEARVVWLSGFLMRCNAANQRFKPTGHAAGAAGGSS